MGAILSQVSLVIFRNYVYNQDSVTANNLYVSNSAIADDQIRITHCGNWLSSAVNMFYRSFILLYYGQVIFN